MMRQILLIGGLWIKRLLVRRFFTRQRLVLVLGLVVSAVVAAGVRFGGDPARSPAWADDRASDAPYTTAKKKVDPIEANGPIFVDWPRPQAALLISGEQRGFLEPCGCAGLDNQKGGLMRRHTLVKELGEKGWPLAMIDLGGQVRRYGPQAVMKFRKAITALTDIGYQAIAFGTNDLRLPTDDLVEVAVNLEKDQMPYVSANVGLFSRDSGFTEPTRIITVGGRRIGVTSILGAAEQAKLNNIDLEMSDPAEALAAVVPQLRDQCDVMVLLSHASPKESRELARKFPAFDYVVTAVGAAEPPKKPQRIDGVKTKLIEVGKKGLYVMVVGFYEDPNTPVRFQRVPLDHRFEDSAEMKAMMAEYQKELQTLGLEGLGLSGSPHSSGRKFVGSKTCAECHTEATDVFEGTPHSHATETLIKLDPPRQFDPECLSCHATGWEPQKYFPFKSGFLGMEATSHLRANGCENCHGPGSRHVEAEQGDVDVDDEELERRREEMRILLAEGEAEGKLSNGKVGRVTTMCMECHDIDNSPDFDFKEYWPKVVHEGKE